MYSRLLSAIVIVAMLAGCSNIAEYYRVSPIMKRNTEKSPTSYYAEDGKSIDVTRERFIKEVKKAEMADTKAERDRLVRELMSLSDDVCELHKAEIISNSNTWNITTGSISNVLAGLGSVIPGETAKAGVAAGAALSNSTRSLVNQEVYSNSLATTIVRAIDVKRKEASAKIELGLSRERSEYSTWAAIYDVDEYHRCCSFIAGLVKVTEALEKKKESKSELKSAINAINDQIKANKDENAQNESGALVAERQRLQLLLGSAPD